MMKSASMSALGAALAVTAALAACDRREPPPPKVGPLTNAPVTSSPAAKTPPATAAGTPSAGAPAASAAASEADRKFVEQAASSGIAEVQIAQHTMANAASADVKKLAEQLHQDHSKANQELTRIATAKGMMLPAAPAPDKRAEVDKIRELSGDDLDRTVVAKLAESHRASIHLFENEARAGHDPALKAFAEKTLPTLREHLKMVERTSAAAGSSAQTAARQ
jgi:putative membrane protein